MTCFAQDKMQSIYRPVVIAICLVFPLWISGCVYGPGYYGPPPHYHYYPHHFDYYFYPSARVYFHFTTGTYYYLDGTIWIKTRVLPPHIRIDSSHRYKIRVESDRPYSRYREHISVYKPRPGYRPEIEANRREREANDRWHEEFQQRPSRRRP